MTDEERKRYVAAIIARDVKVPALEAALIRATHEIQACKDALAQCRCGDLPDDDRDDRT